MSAPVTTVESSPTASGRWVGVATRGVRAHGADAIAVGFLTFFFWWFARHDGGFHLRALATVGWAALAAVPVAVSEARRLPWGARTVLGAWGIGLLVSFTFAAERSRFVRDLIIFALVPVVALVASRLLRRRWGPAVLVLLLLTTVGQFWYESFLTWWGDTMLGRLPRLRPLSWHNQSGMLMGAAGTFFLGLALVGRRVLGAAGVLVAGACLAGAWLSGSRGAVVATIMGALVAVAFAGRVRPWRATVVRSAATLAAAGVVVAVLLSMVQPGSGGVGGQPITNREESATGTFVLRLRHMSAAVGMFADRPLSGQGPGSYRVEALEHTPPNANLTASAHNEYLEAIGEGGIAFGGAFLAAHLLVAAALFRVRRRLTRVTEMDPAELRLPLVVGAAGSVAGLAIHAGVDFDWSYPILPGLLALGVAVLLSQLRTERGHKTALSRGVAAVVLVPVLALGLVAWTAEVRSNVDQSDLSAEEFARSAVPWDHERVREIAWQLSNDGQHELALATIERTITWNPGMRSLQTIRDVIAFRAGSLSPTDLVSSLEGEARFYVHNIAAGALMEAGHYDEAERVLEKLLAGYDAYQAWGIESNRAETWRLLVRLRGLHYGCGEAQQALDDAIAAGATANEATMAAAGLADICPN